MDEQACLGLRERKKIKARLAIERAALELVLERGYDGTTVEDICERAEVSKKTFFNYFPSKAAVVTGRVSEFPEAEQLVVMMEAHSEMCYLDVLVNMISADYTVREGDEMADLRFKMLRKMPQLFFRGQRDLLNVQKAVTEAVGAYLEAHPERRMMDDQRDELRGAGGVLLGHRARAYALDAACVLRGARIGRGDAPDAGGVPVALTGC